MNRLLWIKHKSTTFFPDIIPGWNDQDCKVISVSVVQYFTSVVMGGSR